MKQKQLALSLFDSKRFLLFDGVSTVSIGNKAAEENAFLEDIYMDTEWANSINKTDNSSPEIQLPKCGDFYSAPSQKQSCKILKLPIADSVNVP